MGRKTDVGVLSIYITGDSSDFHKALKSSGQAALAFKAQLKGTMNAISGSVTELNSKLSFVASAASGAFGAIDSLGKLGKLAMEGGSNAAKEFEESLMRLPFGIGAVASAAKGMVETLLGDFYKVDPVPMHVARFQKRQAENLDMMREAQAFQRETEAMAFGAHELTDTQEEGILRKYERDFNAMQDRINEKRQEIRDAEVKGHKRQAMVLEDMYHALQRRQELMTEIKDTQLQIIQDEEKEAQVAKELARQKGLQAEAAKVEAKAQRDGLATQKKLASLRKKMDDQAERVSDAQAGGFTGATTTVSTAIGAYKVADEARTLQIAKQHLKETQREVELLREIKTEIIETVGGVLS